MLLYFPRRECRARPDVANTVKFQRRHINPEYARRDNFAVIGIDIGRRKTQSASALIPLDDTAADAIGIAQRLRAACSTWPALRKARMALDETACDRLPTPEMT